MPPPRKTRGRGTGGARGAARSETSVVAASAPWPADVRYVTSLVFGDDVRHGARGLYEKYRPSGDAPIEASPAQVRKTVRWMRVTEEGHPALGEHGLFAARRLAYGARALDYVGAVSTAEGEDRSSDYVCEFGADGELALDALRVGNEARFINDFRNTGRRPNVEFRLRRSARAAEMRQGVYVCAKEGVRAGDELLISYGKPFWRARVDGSLEDFVTQRPAQPPSSAEPEAP